MFQLQYLNPITGKCSTRYFRTEDGIRKHISKFRCVLPYVIDNLDDHLSIYGCYYPFDDLFDEVCE